ncbi:hypothetical protein D3C87_1543180 [compost metagenome]
MLRFSASPMRLCSLPTICWPTGCWMALVRAKSIGQSIRCAVTARPGRSASTVTPANGTTSPAAIKVATSCRCWPTCVAAGRSMLLALSPGNWGYLLVAAYSATCLPRRSSGSVAPVSVSSVSSKTMKKRGPSGSRPPLVHVATGRSRARLIPTIRTWSASASNPTTCVSSAASYWFPSTGAANW